MDILPDERDVPEWGPIYMHLRKKAEALVAKLDEIHENRSYRGVWSMAHVHGVIYSGPNYETELEELRKALKEGTV